MVGQESEENVALAASTAVIGEIRAGNVLIGNHSLQVNAEGARVTLIDPRTVPKPRPLSPVSIRPRPPSPFVDRAAELDELRAVAREAAVCEVVGPRGIGKTWLLSKLAQENFAELPHGVAYPLIPLRGLPLEDLIREIFDLFFERFSSPELVYLPTHGELARGLQAQRAMVLLDDLSLSDRDMRSVVNHLQSASVIATRLEPVLAGARTLRLSAIPDDALAALAPAERASFAAVAQKATSPQEVDLFRALGIGGHGADGEAERVAATRNAFAQFQGADVSFLRTHRAELLQLLRVGVDQGMHDEVVACVHAVEPTLIRLGAWGTWDEALDALGASARALQNAPELGWYHHEKGVRAYCLDDVTAARFHLRKARKLRGRNATRQARELTRAAYRLPRIRPWWAVFPAMLLWLVPALGVGVRIGVSVGTAVAARYCAGGARGGGGESADVVGAMDASVDKDARLDSADTPEGPDRDPAPLPEASYRDRPVADRPVADRPTMDVPITDVPTSDARPLDASPDNRPTPDAPNPPLKLMISPDTLTFTAEGTMRAPRQQAKVTNPNAFDLVIRPSLSPNGFITQVCDRIVAHETCVMTVTWTPPMAIPTFSAAPPMVAPKEPRPVEQLQLKSPDGNVVGEFTAKGIWSPARRLSIRINAPRTVSATTSMPDCNGGIGTPIGLSATEETTGKFPNPVEWVIDGKLVQTGESIKRVFCAACSSSSYNVTARTKNGNGLSQESSVVITVENHSPDCTR